MLQKKNDVYKKMVNINGTQDPLKKTLLIIDEAHKLYGETPDMTTIEKPNVNVLKKAIHHSFETSGKDSVRLLFMTATPFTNDPMEFIKLINLMRTPTTQINDDFEEFSKLYLDEYGRFDIAAKELLMNDINKTPECSAISYLNRSKDIRQFAKPIFHDVLVPMSLSHNEIPSNNLTQLLRKQITPLNNQIKIIKKEISQAKKNNITFRNIELKKVTNITDKNYIKKSFQDQTDKIINFKNVEITHIQSKINEINKKLNNSKNLSNDLSQETNLNNKCLSYHP